MESLWSARLVLLLFAIPGEPVRTVVVDLLCLLLLFSTQIDSFLAIIGAPC